MEKIVILLMALTIGCAKMNQAPSAPTSNAQTGLSWCPQYTDVGTINNVEACKCIFSDLPGESATYACSYLHSQGI